MLAKISSDRKKQASSSFTSKALWNIWACAQETWDDCGYDNQLVNYANALGNAYENPF